MLEKRIKDNLYKYTASRTHTNTDLERNAEVFFRDWFSSVNYFKEHPEHWGFYPIENDPLERKVPWGILRGQGNETIVMIHHSDTVDTLDYGALSELAYSPEEITAAIGSGELDISEEVKQDLDSGNWLFGRAVADMKGGAAIQLALIEEYSKEEDFPGNILILALPDEENLSAGMRAAVSLLDDLKARLGLDYKLMLNVEPHERTEEGVATIYDGSVGKVMPVIYVRGKLAHVGQVFRGFNPITLLSEIVRRTDLNPGFLERVGNTTTPPPTWLYMKDTKDVYDVSLPAAAAGYMSILTLDRSPMEIFGDLERLCRESFDSVVDDMNISYSRYLELSGLPLEALPWKTKVKSYDDIYREALRDYGESFLEANRKLMEEIKIDIEAGRLSTAAASFKLIEKTLEYVKDLSPLVVIGLAPPYYPNVNNKLLGEQARDFERLVDELLSYSKEELNYPISVQNYYTGISDLSYGMFLEDSKNIEYIENNMLMWRDVYYIPLDLIKKLSMPVINIGPWGKDFHKNTERVLKDDLYHKTPLLIDKVVRGIFK